MAREKHPVCAVQVGQLLHAPHDRLPSNRKTEEGAKHSDRDAQFCHVNEQVKTALGEGRPVISVETKKKELIGKQSNTGRPGRCAKNPLQVNGHDFPRPDVPRAYPHGVSDIGRNTGFVNVGTDHDTGAFAVASIRGWWRVEGRVLYPRATGLLIPADGGGSHGYRRRPWKVALQKLADETRLSVSACHFPPGTSKWNKGEHRLFSFISSNWRGEPLRDQETMVNLISRTTTIAGRQVTCRLDRRKHATGRGVTDEERTRVNLRPATFHGEWNYAIHPARNSSL